MTDDSFFANGISAETGDYDVGQIEPNKLASLARGEKLTKDEQAVVENKTTVKYAYNGDYTDLSDTGWGIIFPTPITPRLQAIYDALKPLRDHRKAQAQGRYKEYWGPKDMGGGYREDEPVTKFIARQGGDALAVDAELVPYYLLLVGSPEEIPYRFQYQLDVTYSSGRLDFERIEDYAQYAENVVNAERDHAAGKFRLPRKVSFWGVETPNDRATELSAEHLIRPLAGDKFPKPSKAQLKTAEEYLPWEKNDWVGEAATKAQLGHLLSGGTNSPALVFTASHGMAFKKENPLQLAHQGALLCQDWPGPRTRGPVKEDWYFSEQDVSQTANLLGRITFFFACYGAGTPLIDEYAKLGSGAEIAPKPFTAALPKKLLTRGVLAAVGHVERAWGYSFLTDDRATLKTFQDTLSDLLYANYPIGAAMEWFNSRYAAAASNLTNQLQKIAEVEKAGGVPDVNDLSLAKLWTTQNDARGYVILGDPAVRLLVAKSNEQPSDLNLPYVLTSYQAPAGLAAAATTVTVNTTVEVTTNTSPAAVTATTTAADSNFGVREWFGGDDKAKPPETGTATTDTDWGQTLKTFGEKLSKFLVQAIDEAVTLEIATYTGEGVTIDELRQDKPANARLVAGTRIELNGNTRLLLPTNEDGRPDQEVLALHMQMVAQAHASRAKLVESAITALGSLTKLGK